MFTDPFNTLSTFDKAATVALYLTLAFAIIALTVILCVKKYRPDSLDSCRKTVGGMCVGYSLGIIGIMLFLKLDEYFGKGYIELATFIPVVCLLCAIIILAVCGLIINIFKPERFKLFAKIALVIISAFVAAILIAHIVLLYKNNAVVEIAKEVMLYIFTAALVAIITVFALLFGKKHEEHNHTKSIVYSAVCMAMSFALSYIRLFRLPQGGSITLASLLPIILYSYMFGIRKGVLTGVAYGFLQFLQDPWFYHPMQFLLDYPIAFGAIGLAGILHELKIFEDKKALQFIIGAVGTVIIRYLSHVVSGIFVFGSADPGYGAVAWSFLYNSFSLADMALVIFAGSALFASKSFLTFLEKSAK